jgi:cytochrome c-type biogenesis protein CcmH/NrfG
MLQGRWEEAHAELQEALRLDPQTPETWFLSGMLWRDGFGDTTRAREAWQRFLALVPADSPQAVTIREWLSALSTPEGAGAVPD